MTCIGIMWYPVCHHDIWLVLGSCDDLCLSSQHMTCIGIMWWPLFVITTYDLYSDGLITLYMLFPVDNPTSSGPFKLQKSFCNVELIFWSIHLTLHGGPSWSWSYGSTVVARCTTLCDKVCQWHATGPWFSPCTPVSSTNKTDRHDIAEILLEVALNTTKQKLAMYFHVIGVPPVITCSTCLTLVVGKNLTPVKDDKRLRRVFSHYKKPWNIARNRKIKHVI